MLTILCKELKNWFDYKQIHGSFEIVDGVISPSIDIRENQYYRIIGSFNNDGVHRWDDTLTDEVFEGSVWLLKIPKEVVQLSEEIDAYVGTYKESPYTSESFGGYSYSKSGDGSWKTIFNSRMNMWRKI